MFCLKFKALFNLLKLYKALFGPIKLYKKEILDFILNRRFIYFLVFLTAKMAKKLLLFIIILLFSNIALAADIKGVVYNPYLEVQNDAVVTVDTVPRQTYIAKDGSYNFELAQGQYLIEARYIVNNQTKSYTSEVIQIKTGGTYIIDLILFPLFEEEIVEDINLEDEYFERKTTTFDIIMFAIAAIWFIVIILLVYRYSRTLKEVKEEVKEASKEVSDLDKQVLDFIKKQGGRTTQKEIRKHFPSSEAKISLVITELENENIIKKIKKGRGNVIILN